MSELKKRVIRIFAIVSAAWILVLAVFYFSMVSPKMKELADLELQVEKASSFEHIQNAKNASRQKLLECEKQGVKVKSFIVDSEGWINIMPHISKIAKELNVSLFSGRDNSSGSNYNNALNDLKKVDIKQLQVSFKSNFYQFARFINELESGEPVIFVKEFEIQRPGDSGSKNEVEMDLEVMVSKTTEKFDNLFAVASSEN